MHGRTSASQRPLSAALLSSPELPCRMASLRRAHSHASSGSLMPGLSCATVPSAAHPNKYVSLARERAVRRCGKPVKRISAVQCRRGNGHEALEAFVSGSSRWAGGTWVVSWVRALMAVGTESTRVGELSKVGHSTRLPGTGGMVASA